MLSKSKLSAASKVIGLMVTMLGFIVIYGWYTHNPALIQINNTFVPMQFNTAGCFVLVSLGLVFEKRLKTLSIICVSIAFLISLFTLCEYLFNVNLSIDELLMNHYITTKSSHPGRMAPNTAICFLLSSFSIFIMLLETNKTHFKKMTINIVIVMFFLSFSAFLGYVTNLPSSYGWRGVTAMAVHTSVGFMLLSLGMLGLIMTSGRSISLSYSKLSFFIGISILMFFWFTLQSGLNKAMLENLQQYGESIKLKIESAIHSQASSVKRLFLRIETGSYSSKKLLHQDINSYIENMPSIVAAQLQTTLKINKNYSGINKDYAKELIKICKQNVNKRMFKTTYKSKAFVYKNKPYYCLGSKNSRNILAINFLTLMKKTLETSYQNHILVKLDIGHGLKFGLFGGSIIHNKSRELLVPLNFLNIKWKIKLTPGEDYLYLEIYKLTDFFLLLGALLVMSLSLSLKLWERSLINYKNLEIETEKKKYIENKFKLVLESSPAVILIVNKKGVIVFSTSQCVNLLGYTAEELYGKKVEILIQKQHGESHLNYRNAYFQNPISKRMGERSDLKVLTKHQKEIPVEISLTPIEMEGEQHVLCMVIDITIKKNLEKEKKHISKITIIYECARKAADADSMEDGMRDCLNLICKHMNWPVGHIYYLSSSKTHLYSSKIWHINHSLEINKFKKISEDITFELSKGLPGRIWTCKKPCWIENIFTDNNFPRAQLGLEAKIQSGAGFPVILNNKVIAVLEFFDLKTKKEDKSMLEVFSVLGEQISRVFEKKLATDNLEESERRNRLLLESAGEGIYGLDLDGNTTFVNPAALKMLGYKEEELKGQKMHTKVHYAYPNGEPYPKESCPMYAAYKDGKIHRVNNEVLWKKDGTALWVEYISSPLYQKNILSGAVVIFNDISDRIEADKKIEQYAAQLKESNKELDDFAYIASHDLKEPLRGISNFSKILLEDYGEKLDDMGKQELETLIRLSDKMSALISSLLTYSRVGRVSLSYQQTDLHVILAEQKELLQTFLTEEKVEIIENTTLPTIRCDKVRIGEVFYNLIVNGVKYNKSIDKKIHIDFTEDDAEYTFVVEDNGIGILKSDYHKIFQIFKRLHSDTEYEGGTGVGMTIIEKIVKKHNGKMWIESIVGKGTKVFFTISKWN